MVVRKLVISVSALLCLSFISCSNGQLSWDTNEVKPNPIAKVHFQTKLSQGLEIDIPLELSGETLLQGAGIGSVTIRGAYASYKADPYYLGADTFSYKNQGVLYSTAVTVTPAQVSVGKSFACYLDAKELRCWGKNNVGQSTVPSHLKENIIEENTGENNSFVKVSMIAAGSDFACAKVNEKVTVNGKAETKSKVECWGNMVQAPTLSNPTVLRAGGRFACVIDGTQVKCWGDNNAAQLDVPTLVKPKHLATGFQHACVIDEIAEGRTELRCWGENANLKTTVPVGLSNPKEVAVGDEHTCALDENGVRCWGLNSVNQTDVPSLNQPTSVVAGSKHTCALDSSGLVCWGDNGLGQGSNPNLSLRKIMAAFDTTCGIISTGIACWGEMNLSPSAVANNGSAMIAAGEKHACVANGKGVQCWGASERTNQWRASRALQGNVKSIAASKSNTFVVDDAGIVGWGDSALVSSIPDLDDVESVVAGTLHACALTATGVSCWGDSTDNKTNVPALTNPSYLAAYLTGTCAIDGDDVKCWGKTGSVPQTIKTFSNPRAIAMGGLPRICVLDDSGVSCFLNSWASVATPALDNLENPTALAVGQTHVCAIAANQVVCHGTNATATLPTDFNAPTALGAYSFGAYTCAVDATGPRCWGPATVDAGQLSPSVLSPVFEGITKKILMQ